MNGSAHARPSPSPPSYARLRKEYTRLHSQAESRHLRRHNRSLKNEMPGYSRLVQDSWAACVRLNVDSPASDLLLVAFVPRDDCGRSNRWRPIRELLFPARIKIRPRESKHPGQWPLCRVLRVMECSSVGYGPHARFMIDARQALSDDVTDYWMSEWRCGWRRQESGGGRALWRGYATLSKGRDRRKKETGNEAGDNGKDEEKGQ